MRLTVNQISYEYGGSNPSLPTKIKKTEKGVKTFNIYIIIIKTMKNLNNISTIIGGGAGASVNGCVML